MRYGFIKVCAATPEIRVADVEFNTGQIIKAIKASAESGSRLTVFPELCVCGYTCGDLFNQKALLDGVENALFRICEATRGIDTLVFVGAPLCDKDNGKLYNCAVAVCNGEFLGAVPKTCIPNYGEFYERRHFSSAPCGVRYAKIKDEIVIIGTDIIFKARNCSEFTVAA